MNAVTNALPDALLSLLRRRLGLEPKSLNMNHLRDQVYLRAKARGAANLDAYTATLTVDTEELQKLTELLCVHETWFFRDAQPFFCLRHFVKKDWPRFGDRTLRALSIPCSTGEEAYSMAIVLQESGLMSSAIRVEGIDISRGALEAANQGSYGTMSFRQLDSEFGAYTERYFRRSGEQWVVGDDLRKLVRFRQANLVDPGFLVDDEPYHVIFCRNLFIYLDEASRQRALQNIYRLIRPGGLLYVGHVEASAFVDSRFSAYSYTFPFAFRRDDGDASNFKTRSGVLQAFTAPPSTIGNGTAPLNLTGLPKSTSGTMLALSGVSNPPTSSPKPLSSPSNPIVPTNSPALKPAPGNSNTPAKPMPAIGLPKPATTGPTIEQARQAADAGRLQESANLCRTILVSHPTAECYALLALVSQAQGNLAEAERCYERALYLDPEHSNALFQLRLICERNGDHAKAENYRRRSHRLGPQKGGNDGE